MEPTYRYSAVITCFNPQSVCAASVESVINSTGPETEIILVDNHSPWPETRRYLAEKSWPDRVRVLDPGRNLGGHIGSNFGSEATTGEYLVKIDDDQVVPAAGWLESLTRPLQEIPGLAYLCLPWGPILPGLTADVVGEGYQVKLNPVPCYFGVTMLRRDLWSQLVFQDPRLYGYEDGYYQTRAQQLGLSVGYLVSHPSVHLARSEHDPEPLYGAYKVLYAWGLTTSDFADWLASDWTEAYSQALVGFGYSPEFVRQIEERRRQLTSPAYGEADRRAVNWLQSNWSKRTFKH